MVEDIVEKKILHKFKYTRGFHDKGIGKLLCPPSFDWDDPSVQSRLKNGDVRPSTAEYPPFLYHSYSINPENKLDGLFRSELLIKAARHIFIAPSAAEDTEAYVKSTRPGNAALNNMSAVTVPTIAYVSVLVRFSLSSEETFNIRLTGARGGFDHWAFYKNIIKFLLDPKMKDKTADLIAFWNSRIFGPREGDEEVDHDTAAEILAGL
ncbi:hypothetical protein FRC03_007737 [Tulasnella sp. 419]|nr:hypothetical protein FRC03_007737 [Tulasnella sp. 419]